LPLQANHPSRKLPRGSELIEVPKDDYRSIRRAILIIRFKERLWFAASVDQIDVTAVINFDMLRNRFYVGEVMFKGEILPGPQLPLLDRSLFDAVQAKLTEQWSHRTTSKQKSKTLLSGLLFDDAENRMIATHATKNRVRYRYYISQPLQRGQSDAAVGSVSHVPADEIEEIIAGALRDRLTSSGRWSPTLSETRRRCNLCCEDRDSHQRIGDYRQSQRTDGASSVRGYSRTG
jgi:hypothetical protein